MTLGELCGEKVEKINMSEEDQKEYNKWLEQLQYLTETADLTNVSISNKAAMKAHFESMEIAINVLKELVLK